MEIIDIVGLFSSLITIEEAGSGWGLSILNIFHEKRAKQKLVFAEWDTDDESTQRVIDAFKCNVSAEYKEHIFQQDEIEEIAEAFLREQSEWQLDYFQKEDVRRFIHLTLEKYNEYNRSYMSRGERIIENSIEGVKEKVDLLSAKVDDLEQITYETTVINKLGTLSPNEPAKQNRMDFIPYYEYITKKFTREIKGEYAKLVGSFSDEESYIEAFIDTPHGVKPALTFLKEWFNQESYGTLLIYGEPGQGKSTLWNKAMYAFYKEAYLPEAKNVLSISLNPGINNNIIQNGTVNIEAILSWNDHPFTFEDCEGALLFIDGFDEFIDEAKKTDISDIFSFMKKIEVKADEYDIHIVVLSRTIAISDALEAKSVIRNKCYGLMPVTEQQQNFWLDQHSEYNDYKETLNSLRNNTDMCKLLGIPFLFRMIVHTRYEGVSKNTVELYDHLIDHLMEKRNIRGKDLKQVITELCNLAYDIYCNDTDTVLIDCNKSNDRWMITFYIKQAECRLYGFYHRSFYQYFLAKYVLSQLLDIDTDKKAEKFIGAFAERELDETVRQYMPLMINEESKVIINNNLKLVIDALARTEAYINLVPRNHDGQGEKTKIGRTINVYRNTLFIVAAFSYVIEKPFANGMDVLIRLYPSNFIKICSNENNRANLSGANLDFAKLLGANLSGADLSNAKLSQAYLTVANLSGANLRGADLGLAALCGTYLSGADLSRANLYGVDLCLANLSKANLSEANLGDANLSEADLSGANLSKASLRGANLNKADLSGVNLSEADLSGAVLVESNLRVKSINYAMIDLNKKELFNPSIEGFGTVVWV